MSGPAIVAVQLGERSYSIAVGSNLLGATTSYQELPRGSGAVIVSNETVAPLYGERLVAALATLYPKVELVSLPDGEVYKTWQTLQTIFDANKVPLHGGHLGWQGALKTGFGGRFYTAKQIAFVVDRGRMPDGPVKAGCSREGCILPAHLSDLAERGYCGTRGGYQRHRAAGEEACPACRQANAKADARLRRTGTSRVLT